MILSILLEKRDYLRIFLRDYTSFFFDFVAFDFNYLKHWFENKHKKKSKKWNQDLVI